YLLSKPVDGKAMEALIEETRKNSISTPAPTSAQAFSIPTDIGKGLMIYSTAPVPPAFEEAEEVTEAATLVPAEDSAYPVLDERAYLSEKEDTGGLHSEEPMEAYREFSASSRNENRRRSERFKLVIPTRVVGYGRKAGKWDEMAQTTDVSKAGVTL